MEKKEKRAMNRSLVMVLLVVLFAMILTGCSESAEESSVPATSEVISEVVSEEPSEEVSEVVSEEVSEEATPQVEVVNFSNINELLEYAKERNQLTIAEFDFSVDGSSQAIIPNGSNYTMQMGERLQIIAVKEVESIDANVDGIGMRESVIQDVWTIDVYNDGTDIEVSFTINYTDGTSEDFVIYVAIGDEVVSENSLKEEGEVDVVNFSNVDELVAYLTGLNKTSIVEFNFSVDENSQSIIPNGSKYTMQRGERLHVISTKEVESIDANVDDIAIMETRIPNVWAVGVYNSGTDMEVSFTVNYKDGTSEDFTIYVTRE